MRRKSYDNKKLKETINYTSYSDVVRSGFSRWKLVRVIVVLACIALVLWIGRRVAQAIMPVLMFVSEKTTEVVSKQIGVSPVFDDSGALNILLMGYGGETHQGGFLTDSIMVASFHPESGIVTFLSLPRDLWVKSHGYQGRINSLFPHAMLMTGYTNDTLSDALDWSSQQTIEKVEDITGLHIPYYVLVSFEGFQHFIDELGGVVVDVPRRLVDYEFPDVHMKGYDPLIVEPGKQLMDGALALKYARSRKSTSDFSRSERQQQIIKAIMTQIQGSISISNIAGMEKIYDRYQEMVTTNLTLKNLLYMAQYKDSLRSFSSYVLTYECSGYFTQMVSGCFLTTPPREWFDGAAVLVPTATTANNLENYDDIHDFAYLITSHPGIAEEGGTLTIYNAISDQAASDYNITPQGKANIVATKLVQYGFDVDEIENTEKKYPRTMAYVYGSGSYADTIDALKLFMDVDVYTGELLSGHLYHSPIELYLGDNFLENYTSTTNRFWQ